MTHKRSFGVYGKMVGWSQIFGMVDAAFVEASFCRLSSLVFCRPHMVMLALKIILIFRY